jgi:hypothetical protein
MAGMGPPPKPAGTRARRNAAPQTTKLSADGRTSKRTPAWPLEPDVHLTVDKTMAAARIKELRAELANFDGTVIEMRKRERELASVERRLMERKLWAELWKTPQAAMWEKFAWSREVAQYVRFKIRGELRRPRRGQRGPAVVGPARPEPAGDASAAWEIERTEDAEERGRKRRSRTAPAPAGEAGGSRPARLPQRRELSAPVALLVVPLARRGAVADARPAGLRLPGDVLDLRPGLASRAAVPARRREARAIYRAYEVYPKGHHVGGRRRFKRVGYLGAEGPGEDRAARAGDVRRAAPEGPVDATASTRRVTRSAGRCATRTSRCSRSRSSRSRSSPTARCT